MSFLFKLLKRKTNDDGDYEAILSALAIDIQKRQQKLSEIRLRERRATLLVTLYTLSAWVAYVGAWYVGLFSRGTGIEKGVKAVPVLLGPILILFVRRIVQVWYASKGDAEERTLRDLMKQQRAKVEEIKKKTNYYTTRDLLQRYDEQSPSNSPLQTPQRPPPQQQKRGPRQSMMPQQPQTAPSTPQPPAPPQPQRKQWFDKLADAVLGDDDGADQARYALICEQCFAHNGLVKESVWDDTQYVCPKCQHFNPSRKARREGRVQGPSPTSPLSPTLQQRHPQQQQQQQQQPEVASPSTSHIPGVPPRSPPQKEGDSMDLDS